MGYYLIIGYWPLPCNQVNAQHNSQAAPHRHPPTLQEAEALDGSGAHFQHDRWSRDATHAGYGITSVLEGGRVLEKAAVNVSVVAGVLSRERAHTMSARGRQGIDPEGGQGYSAAALSLVFHSGHPEVPTLRADVRLFEVDGQRW